MNFRRRTSGFSLLLQIQNIIEGQRIKKVFNATIATAFPDNFLDYTDFYVSRSPQRMIDTIHWDEETYFDLISNVIETTRQKKQGTDAAPDYAVAEVQAVFYTNGNTIILEQPDMGSTVLFPTVEAGLPILVTGVTENGFFRVSLGELVGFVPGSGLMAGE